MVQAGGDLAGASWVLFLDELPEFNSRSLEAMRQPLEGQRQVTISRAQGTLTFPASFMLV